MAKGVCMRTRCLIDMPNKLTALFCDGGRDSCVAIVRELEKRQEASNLSFFSTFGAFMGKNTWPLPERDKISAFTP